MNKYQTIGKIIKEERESRNISQKDLAEKMGFQSATAISLIESGERKIDIEKLQKISKILEKDIKFFLGDEDKQDTNFKVALRADKNLKDLTENDHQQILNFIDFVKKNKKK